MRKRIMSSGPALRSSRVPFLLCFRPFIRLCIPYIHPGCHRRCVWRSENRKPKPNDWILAGHHVEHGRIKHTKSATGEQADDDGCRQGGSCHPWLPALEGWHQNLTSYVRTRAWMFRMFSCFCIHFSVSFLESLKWRQRTLWKVEIWRSSSRAYFLVQFSILKMLSHCVKPDVSLTVDNCLTRGSGFPLKTTSGLELNGTRLSFSENLITFPRHRRPTDLIKQKVISFEKHSNQAAGSREPIPLMFIQLIGFHRLAWWRPRKSCIHRIGKIRIYEMESD